MKKSACSGVALSLALFITSLGWGGCGDSGGGGGSGTDAGLSFTIGGTVTGLTGTGLTLSNGAAMVSIPSGATTFSFASTFASGSMYSVQVSGSPSTPTQTCVVTNGEGTLTANVTNVSVACTTDSYPVSVTVTGLFGSDIVLRNNGGDDLTIEPPASPGDVTSTFATHVPSGSAFDVSVAMGPTAPNFACDVVGGTGTVGGAAVNVTVNCACAATMMLCDDGGPVCTPVQDDEVNCGGCGQVCSPGDTCTDGGCHGRSTFNFTGGPQTFTVPAHVTSVFVQVWGGQGGAGGTGGTASMGGAGGLGGFAEGWLAVSPGQVLTVYVGGLGGSPSGGFNGGGDGGSASGGGGGGASDVRTGAGAVADRVIVGGGGGGGGGGGCESPTIAGGAGGDGGGGSGANGADAPNTGGSAGGGRGGTSTGPGAAGIGCEGLAGMAGRDTSTEVGGAGGRGSADTYGCPGAPSTPGGGGGGGGFVGGNGGGGGSVGSIACTGNEKGAGGGGSGGLSSLLGVTSGAIYGGVWLGHGRVDFTW